MHHSRLSIYTSDCSPQPRYLTLRKGAYDVLRNTATHLFVPPTADEKTMRADTPSVPALASNSYRASKATFHCWQQSGPRGPATQGAWPSFGTKGSQVPQHLPSTTTNSHLSSFSAHIQSGQIIPKSEYRCNAGNSLPNPLLKRPRSRWPPSRPCSFTTGAAYTRVCRISL